MNAKLVSIAALGIILVVVWRLKPSSTDADVMAVPGAAAADGKNAKQFGAHNAFPDAGVKAPARAKLEKLIADDPDLRDSVNFDAYSAHALRGVANSPEALDRLRAAFEKAKSEIPALKCEVSLAPGWTPNFVVGRVLDSTGAPVAGARVGMYVTDPYISPETEKTRARYARPGFDPSSMAQSLASQWFVSTDKDGAFSWRHIPSTDKPVRVTVESGAKRKQTTIKLPADALTITLDK